MTYERVTLVLTEHEMQELRRLAQRELRRPRDQAAYIIRSVLLDESPPQRDQQPTKNTDAQARKASAGV